LKLTKSIVLALCGASVPALAHAGGALFAEDPAALENACGGADGCWTNYLRVTDLDGDDDLDVVTVNYEGFFAAGQPEPLAVYTNDGAGVFANTSAASVGGFSGRIRQVAIGDVDGDGDPDMYVPDANGGADNLFVNEGGVFEPMEIDLGSNAGAARFGDLDDDGDLDLFLADGYNATDTVHGHVYLNDGDGGFTELDGAIPAPAGSDPDDVDFLDADGDFDLDIMLNNHSGTNELWLNEGDGTFVDATSGLPSFPGGFHYGPAMCDVDGDGDLDAWVDNMGPDYSEMLLINDGTGTFTDETAARVSGNGNNDDNGLVCLDIDYDGDLDAVVISLFTAERYLENDGAGNFGSVSGVFAQPGQSELWGELGDVNGDGRLDLVTGAGESGTVDRVFLGTAAQTADATPPAFRAVQTDAAAEPDTDFAVHFGVVDNAVTDEGPRLHAAFARVDAGDGPQEIPASFMGGDLFRVVVPGQPDGTTVNVTVCATDREDNEGCAEPFDVEVGAAGTGGTTAGTDDSGGTDPTDDTADSGADTTMGDDDDDASATDPDDDDDSASEDDDSSGSGPPSDGDDGCNCTQSTSTRPTAGLALLVAFGLRRRRRVRSS
jgi:MYXO-CTERM domain-containing protein